MKKVGVITSSYSMRGSFGCNYGAALQGFALIKQLKLMGYDAWDLNYLSENEYNPDNYNMITRTLKRIGFLFNINVLKKKIRSIKDKDKLLENYNSFMRFVKDNELTYNNGAFFKFNDLVSIGNEFYAFITGSDVVWNPYNHNKVNDRGFFLDFVPKGVKRIAYAPSIGVCELPDESKCDLKELLEKFDALSIREKSGSVLVKNETGIDIPVVLDPTLLLDLIEYEKVISEPKDIPKEYIAVYKFGNISDTDEKIREISSKLNLPIVFIPSGFTTEYTIRYDLGPGEFLSVIKNASLVLTDSFHCSIFSLIFHTPFLAFNRTLPGKKGNINSRMTNLLDATFMSQRMVNPNDEIDYNNLFKLNFERADEVIALMRAESLMYLNNALEQ